VSVVGADGSGSREGPTLPADDAGSDLELPLEAGRVASWAQQSAATHKRNTKKQSDRILMIAYTYLAWRQLLILLMRVQDK